MTDHLQPYLRYEPSNELWLGDIPAHWHLRRLKYIFAEKSIKGYPDEPLLAATQRHGVILKERYEDRTVVAQSGLENLKLVEVGDFVISLRSFEGGIEVAHHRGIISPAYTVIAPIDDQNRNYFVHLFKSKPFVDGLKLCVTGIREGQNIDYSRLQRVFIPLPPPDEQAAIVRFLDHADRLIRRYIRAKRRLIKLLEEQKQAIVQQAVTRGLDPDVPMKDSGVEWLGEIPTHWKMVTLKRMVSIIGGMTPSKSEVAFWGGNIPWISPKDMKVTILADSEDHITETALKETNIPVIPAYSVLMVVRGMILLHKVPVAMNAIPVTINQDMKALVPKAYVSAEYLHTLLAGMSDLLLAEVDEAGHGTRRLPTERWVSIKLPIPPRKEQNEIHEYINHYVGCNTIFAYNIQNGIDLVREYHTRLIANVVTGKLDVREAARHLPNLPEDEEGDLYNEEDLPEEGYDEEWEADED